MKNIFLKKKNQIILPVLDSNQLTPEIIMNHLTEDTPILAWYHADKLDTDSTITSDIIEQCMTFKRTNIFRMYRKEDDDLCKYYGHFVDGQLRLNPYEVIPFSYETVKELVEFELSMAYEVYRGDERFN